MNAAPLKHGTRSAYVNGRCRCELCTEANREYMRDWMRARHVKTRRGRLPPEVHGTIRGYNYFCCRCPRCKQAGREARAERKAE